MKHGRGFTLFEVAIALAILSIGVLAAMRAVSLASNGAEEMESRQLAEWVAQNRLAEIRATGLFPDAGVSVGHVIQGGRRFRWREEVRSTESPLFRRVDLVVFAEGKEHALAQLSGLAMAPRQ